MKHLEPVTDTVVVKHIQSELRHALVSFQAGVQCIGIDRSRNLLGLRDVVNSTSPWRGDVRHFELRHAPHKVVDEGVDGYKLPREYLIECARLQIGEEKVTEVLLELEG